jgi:hypothetical protein
MKSKEESLPTKESFLKDVENHVLVIMRDDGVYKHIRIINKSGSTNMYYEIVTWPGYLAYVGDMGSYVFSRTHDMFSFFRNDKMEINTQYWAEKVQAESIFGNGVREFDVQKFHDNVVDYVRSMLDLGEDASLPDDVLDELAPLLKSEDEWECVASLRDFYSDKLDFTDFFEMSCNTKTYYYVWCCYAIVYAIALYDKEVDKE